MMSMGSYVPSGCVRSTWGALSHHISLSSRTQSRHGDMPYSVVDMSDCHHRQVHHNYLLGGRSERGCHRSRCGAPPAYAHPPRAPRPCTASDFPEAAHTPRGSAAAARCVTAKDSRRQATRYAPTCSQSSCSLDLTSRTVSDGSTCRKIVCFWRFTRIYMPCCGPGQHMLHSGAAPPRGI